MDSAWALRPGWAAESQGKQGGLGLDQKSLGWWGDAD